MEKPGNELETLVLTEGEAVEFFAYLISAARIQVDEPSPYTSMRLLSAAEKLREYIRARVSAETGEMLNETDALTNDAQLHTADQGIYTSTLDELCRMLAAYLVDVSGLKGKRS
jgi:hypothetical protein